ncbi:MAG: hypothetical protein SFU27_13670 [Thermonemataceae bacterium]|nr:hypothetical protein [Thermonemataceae bacterium]
MELPNGSYISYNDPILPSPIILFDAQNSALQIGAKGRSGTFYGGDITFNPLGGNVKISNDLFVRKNVGIGNHFKMSNPAVSGNYNAFEIFFENLSNQEGEENRIILRNNKKYSGTFIWQNLGDNDNPLDLMRLDNGGLRVAEFFTSKATVKIDYWNDKVFEDNYNLRKLSEVENYVKINKHLPDVPSEKDILMNGLSLGDMQATQMLKIEELTLYIINQEKRIKALESKITELNKKIGGVK